MNEVIYRDVLGRCLISNATFWVRIQCQHKNSASIVDAEDDARFAGVGREFTTGNVIVVTNLKPLRSTGCATPLFLMDGNSIAKMVNADKIKVNEKKANAGGLRYLFRCEAQKDGRSLSGSELSFSMVICGWTTTALTATGDSCEDMSGSNSKLFSYQPVILNVFGYENRQSGVCIVMQYPLVAKEIEKSLSWLHVNAQIELCNVLLMQVDSHYDVLHFRRYDRTVATLASCPDESMKNVTLAEDIRLRILSLQNNCIWYHSQGNSSEFESCRRFYLYHVELSLQSHCEKKSLNDSDILIIAKEIDGESIRSQHCLIAATEIIPPNIHKIRFDLVTCEISQSEFPATEASNFRRIKWIGLSSDCDY